MSKDFKISEIRESKEVLQDSIQKLVSNFEEKHNLIVDIDVFTDIIRDDKGCVLRKGTFIGVKIEL